MIKFWLALQNPFKCDEFKNYGCKTVPLTTNKTFEIQLTHYAFNWFEINVDLSWNGRDHAGPSIELNLFGYTLDVKIYDNRHWKYSEHKWEEYNGPCETV